MVPVQSKITQINVFPGYKPSNDIKKGQPKDHSGYRFTTTELEFKTKNSRFIYLTEYSK